MSLFGDRSTAGIWMAVILIVAAAVAGFQFLRANRPEPQAIESQAPTYTRGAVVDGLLNIPADEYRSFRLNFNKKTKILGTHWTGNSRKRVLVLILAESDFEKWKAGQEFNAVTQTGFVPRGKVERVMDPGVYYLVYDNRSAEYGGDQKMEASFTAD